MLPADRPDHEVGWPRAVQTGIAILGSVAFGAVALSYGYGFGGGGRTESYPQFTLAQSVWPDNEPANLTSIYGSCTTAGNGILIDGSQLQFDYSGAGGSDCSTGFFFGGKWAGDSVKVVGSVAGSRYGSVIRKKLYNGDGSGWNGLANDDDWATDQDSLYIRAIIYIHSGFDFHGGGDKLFYWGAGGAAGNSFFIQAFESASGKFVTRIINQASNCEDCGEFRFHNDTLSVGEWNTFEIFVRNQTAAGADDGGLRYWVNDTERTWSSFAATASGTPETKDSIAWFSGASSTTQFSGAQLFWYYGGSGESKIQDDSMDISEFYLTGSN
jgi:hypothetical protein